MRRIERTSAGAALALASLISLAPQAHASAYDAKPKLVVVLVLDQFRGDYMDRYRADFHTPNGFNLFLNKGAYFPECYYGYANTMTAPGHSSIGTGAYTDGHNIAVNDWWDLSRSTTHMVSSVEDAEFPLVGGSKEAALGASPRNELASTFGDEVVLSTGGQAKLFGVSLKDRASILTSGHAQRAAYWIDHATGLWETSTYWRKELPPWVNDFNRTERDKALKAANVAPGDFYETVGATAAGVQYEIDFAEALIKAEGLGRDKVTDVLTLSISSTDILGHRVGPDSPVQRALMDAIDGQLNGFAAFLNKNVDGGLGNVWIALTGDHGVAPSPAAAAAEGLPAAAFDGAAMNTELNRELNAKFDPNFNRKGEARRFVLGGDLPYVQLDAAAFAGLNVDEKTAEDAAAALLPEALARSQASVVQHAPAGSAESAAASRRLRRATLRQVYTRSQIAAGEVPDTRDGQLILHSFSTNGGWWVLVTPGMFQMSGHGAEGTNHFTPYSYDRHVPLAFFGAPFVPGTYMQHTEPVDIAATFAALLRVNQPSSSVGRVVVEALRPQPAATASGPRATAR